MRSIWTGSISFGLVNIPVKLYSATDERELNFRLLSKKELCPISYVRVCRSSGREVPYEEIVKGYEYQKGDFVVLTDEDFKKADPRETKSISIDEFINEEEIAPEYFERPYYLEPAKGAENAYALLREALKKSKKIAIGKFVLRNRESLVALKPDGNLLIVEKMRFPEQIRSSEDLKVPKGTVKKGEIDIALKLIDQMTSYFDPKKYKDEYTAKLKKVIATKAKGKPVRPMGEEPIPTPIGDLMSALKESLEKSKQ